MSCRVIYAILVCAGLACAADVARAQAADDSERDPRLNEAQTAPPAVPVERISGIRVEADPESQPGLWPKRVVLAVPRLAFNAIMAPPRFALWAVDRYSLESRFKRVFFNYDGTLGFYPFVDVESGFGASIGVAYVNYGLFDRTAQTKWSARTGGRNGATFQAELAPRFELGGWLTGRLLGRLELESTNQFFGFGNSDESGRVDAMAAPLDPHGDRAARTDYRHRDIHASFRLRARVARWVRLELETSFLDREYSPGLGRRSAAPVQDVFDTADLNGFDGGLRNIYTRVGAIVDSRRVVASYRNPRVYAGGWLFGVRGGYVRGISGDDTRYWRYSGDLRRYVDLFGGDRVLVLRARLLGVIGEEETIPFDHLPFLGGRSFLRGYPSQRFRDRASVLSSAEYQYPINHYLGGYLFVDGGRVYRELSDFDTRGVRVGFGGGVDYRNATSTLIRMALSSSIDGSIYFNLGFESVPDVHTH